MAQGSVKLDKKTGLYYYVVDVGKKGEPRKQKKERGFKKKKDAQDALTDLLNQVNKGDYIEPSKIKFTDYMLDVWIVEKVQNKLITRLTAKNYRSCIVAHMAPFFKDTTLGELNSSDIKKFVKHVKSKKLDDDEGYADSYVQRIFDITAYSLNYAIKSELIRDNPAKKLDRPRRTKKKLSIWSIEQIQKFLGSLKDNKHYIIFFLAIHTGMRQGEILGLPWRNIDFINKRIMITQTLEHDGKRIKQGAKTTSGVRSIGVSDEIIEVLRQRHEVVNNDKLLAGDMYVDNDLVCCTNLGKPIFPTTLTRLMQRTIKELELPHIRFHDLRHTAASLMLSIGVHPKVVSEILGHSSVSITLDTYSHLLMNMQSDATQGLSSLLSKKEETEPLEIEQELRDQKCDQPVEV
ncbi:tyrosine-type recombinase/integrase [Paenibacillus sp. NRS-1782]|uniref:tyrosine-type recombinase/integrase n=1 Tax=unclassified Paenibacillus TaxID=185978 RepID=UPI003D2864E6